MIRIVKRRVGYCYLRMLHQREYFIKYCKLTQIFLSNKII
nr:MAG TPA: hypothetical protein [Caudoviricetes sp.]